MAAPCPAQPQQAFEDVVRNLRNPDAKARMSAVQRLRESRHVEAAVPVAAVITDPVEAIQLEAIAAELSFFLVDEVPARRRAGLLVEVRSKGQAQPAFELGPLVTWSRSAPPEVIDGLLKAVDDEDSRVRTEAIYALGVIGRPPLTNEAADRLITALDHYDPVIRSAAARVIGRLEVGRAGDALIGAINDSTLAVRYAAMRGLGDLREVRAIQALTDQLSFYRTGEGAWSALDGLARIGHASSAPLFKARLADKDPYFRRVAAEGLARLGDQSESAAIQAAAAKDASLMVRAAMTFALAKADPGAVAQLVEFFASDKIALQVQGYLLELGPASRPGVSAALKHPNANVRAGAADVIGTVGTAESVALLEPLTKDRDRAVARSASAAIERIKQRR
ncbi:MAG: HEAT repeat domain-containing protein [Vicinamibacterales bacterium]